VISLEDGDHERIACEVLSPNQFVEKTKKTLYGDFKNVCTRESVAFPCFKETNFQWLQAMCSTLSCSTSSSLKSREGENVPVLSSKSRTMPGQENQSDTKSRSGSVSVLYITIDDD
jgi:hypothetical protein